MLPYNRAGSRFSKVRALCSFAWVAILSLACATGSFAQKLAPRPFPQRRVESYSLQSTVMGVKYDVSVGLPTDYEANPNKKYPALLVTDGDEMFPMAQNLADGLMGQGNGQGAIEGLFVVSVSVPLELGDTMWAKRRIYEFSPPNWPMADEFGKVVWSICSKFEPKPTKEECVGGAPRFLSFIVQELLPALYERFRVDPDRLGLFGISAGGFFASYVVFQPETPFKNYIISSPAMAYGDGEIFRQEAKYAESHKDLNVGIYMASGSLEMDDPFLEGVGRIVSGQSHLAATLQSRKYPGLRLYTEIHSGLGHIDSGPATLARGLRLLYPNKTTAGPR